MILLSISLWTWHLRHEHGAMALSREDTKRSFVFNISLIILHFPIIQPSMTEILDGDGQGEERLFLFLKYYMKQFPDAFTSMYVPDFTYFDAKPLNGSLITKKNSYSISHSYSLLFLSKCWIILICPKAGSLSSLSKSLNRY